MLVGACEIQNNGKEESSGKRADRLAAERERGGGGGRRSGREKVRDFCAYLTGVQRGNQS